MLIRFLRTGLLILLVTMMTGLPVTQSDNTYYVLAQDKKEKKFALNFNDVEITEFLHMMSKLTGKNIIIDDRVKGRISISSARKVPVSQAYEIMKSILEVKGYAVVESRGVIKVIPVQEAIKKNQEVVIDGEKQEISFDSDKTMTYLLELRIAEAREVAQAITPLKSKFTDIVIYQPLNTIILSGTSSEIKGLIEIARALDRQAEQLEGEKARSGGNIHVVHLENANAEQLGEVLSRIPFSQFARINTEPRSDQNESNRKKRVTRTQVEQKTKTKLSIVANKDTNSLIITATPAEFREIRRVISELDIVREQVLIEALIIEVNAEHGWGFGIDWMLGNQTGTNMYGGSSVNNQIPNFSTPSGLGGRKMALPAAMGLQLGYLSDTSILSFAVLNATGRDSNFNILSTPQILTIDNHEAELNVGEEIPVPTNNRISESGTQFYTYEYKPVGVKLKITPHITKKKHITLDLYQEVNSVLGETTIQDGNIIPPTLGKRDIKTKVTVRDGKTIVVGGLITNNKIEEETGVPVLKDIPILGWLFKRKTVSYKKANLLVFITPHIVTKQERIDSMTRKKREGLKRLQEK